MKEYYVRETSIKAVQISRDQKWLAYEMLPNGWYGTWVDIENNDDENILNRNYNQQAFKIITKNENGMVETITIPERDYLLYEGNGIFTAMDEKTFDNKYREVGKR